MIEGEKISTGERDKRAIKILDDLANETGFRVDKSLRDGSLDQLAEGLLHIYTREEDKRRALAIGFAALELAALSKQTPE